MPMDSAPMMQKRMRRANDAQRMVSMRRGRVVLGRVAMRVMAVRAMGMTSSSADDRPLTSTRVARLGL